MRRLVRIGHTRAVEQRFSIVRSPSRRPVGSAASVKSVTRWGVPDVTHAVAPEQQNGVPFDAYSAILGGSPWAETCDDHGRVDGFTPPETYVIAHATVALPV